LYKNIFDSSNEESNLLGRNFNGTGDGQFLLTFSLQINNVYIFVVSPHWSTYKGLYTFSISGPGFTIFVKDLTVRHTLAVTTEKASTVTTTAMTTTLKTTTISTTTECKYLYLRTWIN
jgi:hypothetical protein